LKKLFIFYNSKNGLAASYALIYGIICNTEAVKRVLAFQFEKELKKQKMTKSQFAKKMKTSRTAVDRLLDPKKSCSLKSLVIATSALGKTLEIRVV